MTSSIRHQDESQLDVRVKSRNRVPKFKNIVLFSFVLKLLSNVLTRKT